MERLDRLEWLDVRVQIDDVFEGAENPGIRNGRVVGVLDAGKRDQNEQVVVDLAQEAHLGVVVGSAQPAAGKSTQSSDLGPDRVYVDVASTADETFEVLKEEGASLRQTRVA